MVNIKIKRIIFSFLIVINCLVIFCFSAQNSEKSSETSGVIVNKVTDLISNVNKNINKDSIKDTVTFIVRKCAHFSIYVLLGIWLICLANTFEIATKRKILIGMVYGLLYAVSDEIHQYFVSGRSAEIRDVCIDTCGVLCGILFVLLVNKIIQLIRKPEQVNNS